MSINIQTWARKQLRDVDYGSVEEAAAALLHASFGQSHEHMDALIRYACRQLARKAQQDARRAVESGAKYHPPNAIDFTAVATLTQARRWKRWRLPDGRPLLDARVVHLVAARESYLHNVRGNQTKARFIANVIGAVMYSENSDAQVGEALSDDVLDNLFVQAKENPDDVD